MEISRIMSLKLELEDQCEYCNGYGSSFKESAERCTKCNGTGIKPSVYAQIVGK
jgi:DnaJ-class molecular chaperone